MCDECARLRSRLEEAERVAELLRVENGEFARRAEEARRYAMLAAREKHAATRETP